MSTCTIHGRAIQAGATARAAGCVETGNSGPGWVSPILFFGQFKRCSFFQSCVTADCLPSVFRLGFRMPWRDRMHIFQITKISVITLALLVGPSWVGPVDAQSPETQPKPDNTAVNKRDRNPGEATADQQKNGATDREMTAKIRRSVMDDKSLSTYAHNIKIISQDGTVTLKGPVRSDNESKSIVSMATDVTGSADKVINQMSVKPTSKP